jgi:hypothetical protein
MNSGMALLWMVAMRPTDERSPNVRVVVAAHGEATDSRKWGPLSLTLSNGRPKANLSLRRIGSLATQDTAPGRKPRVPPLNDDQGFLPAASLAALFRVSSASVGRPPEWLQQSGRARPRLAIASGAGAFLLADRRTGMSSRIDASLRHRRCPCAIGLPTH